MDCPSCGSPLDPQTMSCASCGPNPVPPKRMSTRAIVAIIVAAALIVAGVAVTAILLIVPRVRDGRSNTPSEGRTAESSTSPLSESDAESGELLTPEAAAARSVPKGYVLQRDQESPDRVVFWSGPSVGQWELVVEVHLVDGGWKVTRTGKWSVDEAESASDESEDAASAQVSSAASDLVTQFLDAIQDDRPADAQRLTVPPLRQDPASAQVSNGEFTSFTIDSVEPKGDGGYWVSTTETWVYGTEQWRYDIVSVAGRLRIRNLEPAGQ